MSGGRDDRILIFDTKGYALADPVKRAKKSVYSVAVAPDGAWLAAGGRDHMIRLFVLSDLGKS